MTRANAVADQRSFYRMHCEDFSRQSLAKRSIAGKQGGSRRSVAMLTVTIQTGHSPEGAHVGAGVQLFGEDVTEAEIIRLEELLTPKGVATIINLACEEAGIPARRNPEGEEHR